MADRLTVVCWLWKPHPGFRDAYTVEHVSILRRMVARYYPYQHRFVCVTDVTEGMDPDVEVVPLWETFADIPNPYGSKYPSCYRRLRMFAPEIAEVFGTRFVSLDLDVVITGDVSSLWNRPDPFVIWKDTHFRARYNGSMMLMTAGARSQVWTDFDPVLSPALTFNTPGCAGSDQGWISFRLGDGEATWTKADGVYSFRNEIDRMMAKLQASHTPDGVKIVFFHGPVKPWSPYAQRFSWVRASYC